MPLNKETKPNQTIFIYIYIYIYKINLNCELEISYLTDHQEV